MRSIEASAKPTSPITRRAASRIWSVRKSRRTCSRVLPEFLAIVHRGFWFGREVRYVRFRIRARPAAGRSRYCHGTAPRSAESVRPGYVPRRPAPRLPAATAPGGPRLLAREAGARGEDELDDADRLLGALEVPGRH